MISPKLCVKCKGKLLCGMSYCPILQKHSTQKNVVSKIRGNRFTGSSPPSLFVSWNNYPKVQIAPLSPTEVMDSELFDAPEKWFGLTQDKIVSFREQLLRSNKQANVFDAAKPSYELLGMQELVMATRPTAIDVKLKSSPVPQLSFHEGAAPHGPSAPLVEMRFEENPKISRKIDYAVSDTDMKSSDALLCLYNAGFPVSRLDKLLSAGTLGIGKDRKLVPTRWSIVASQDTIGKALIEEIKYFQQLGEIELFTSEYVGNRFFVLLIPGAWAFENLETWIPGSMWYQEKDTSKVHVTQDHEFYTGRKGYASNVEGAYYAARLSVCEHLKKIKRQAAALVFREITPEYNIGLGNWVIQESVKNALSKNPMHFSSLSLALAFVERKLQTPFKLWKKESKLLDFLQHQKRLADF
ncbi:MAG: hypothetical protein JW744_05350 [Candidatus Diapherotrites archaeon]|uniref:DNA repair protein n=1 Tax=Candidatus Iainarchaeum sp. TaxID=3101447 RepID=A0A938YXB3_9ARCH|nr:hypothetical protein [Candidatus Diapherotrites archaeon]